MRDLKLTIVAAGLAFAVPASVQAQDAAAGAKVFNQCRACHQIGPSAKNLIGPKLNGIVDRKAGSIEEFNYSTANKDSGLTWDAPTLTEYLRDPKAKMPGTKMVFAGLKSDTQIADLIAYLKQYDADGKTP